MIHHRDTQHNPELILLFEIVQCTLSIFINIFTLLNDITNYMRIMKRA